MTPNEKRCEDCSERKMVKGVACCYECFNQPCNDVDDCPLGLTAESVVEAQTLTAEQKKTEKAMKNCEVHTETKKRERKVAENPEKEALISSLYDFLVESNDFTDISITNKTREITFYKDGQRYTLTLIASRKPKEKK